MFRRDPETKTMGQLVRISLLGVSALGSQSTSFAQAPGSKPAPASLVEARACGLEVRVSDPTDAPIAGAQVSVVRKHASPAAQRGTTDVNGLFRDRLSVGHYEL